MTLTLRIENETSLPDGGPLSVTVPGRRGIDIGRDQYLDWTLPDPSRFISGKHCEIRWRDGAYWLHDISTNGTFLHGAASRLKAPHKLRDGDRFLIGHYIIVATIQGDDAGMAAQAARVDPAPSYDELWNPVGEAAPPIDPRQLKAPRDLQPVRPDFLDWAVDVPEPEAAPQRPRSPAPSRPGSSPMPQTPPPSSSRGSSPWDLPAAAADDIGWAQGTPKPPPPEPEPVAVPSPRRPVWVAGEPNGPWAGAAQPAAQPGAQPAALWPPAPAAANVLAAAQALAATAAGAAGAPAAPAAPVPPERAAPQRGSGGAVRAGGAAPVAAGISFPIGSFPIGPADAAAAADFVRLVARGAGLPDDALAGRNPAELAGELGQLMRLIAENAKQLLEARQHAKRLVRSSNQTMVQATNNNPLKFAPTVEDALRIMFGPPTRSYLDARRAFAQSFDDLKAHQVKTFSAMQHALKLLLAEFDPEEIENASTGDRGLAGVVGSRKARLWDIYVTRWEARTRSHEDGIVNAFMDYFAQCYDRD